MKKLFASVFFLLILANAYSEIKGNYSLVPGVTENQIPKENSLDQVKVIEIFSFTCPHCNNANKLLPEIQKKFGDKLQMMHYEIGWMGPNPSKFYYLAVRNGKDQEARDLLFSAFHESNIKSLNNPVFLGYFAGELGIEQQFKSDFSKPDLMQEFLDKKKQIGKFGINSTPAYVVEDKIVVKGANLQNLQKVINSLLKEPVK